MDERQVPAAAMRAKRPTSWTIALLLMAYVQARTHWSALITESLDSVFFDAHDVDFWSSDHCVLVNVGAVEPQCQLGRPVFGEIGHRLRVGGAPGDVTRGVLVDQTMPEHHPALPDWRSAVNQCNLSQARRSVVDGQLRAHALGPASGFDLHDATRSKPQS